MCLVASGHISPLDLKSAILIALKKLEYIYLNGQILVRPLRKIYLFAGVVFSEIWW